jgi:hypothetical protein
MTRLRKGQVSSIVCTEDLEYEFSDAFQPAEYQFCVG